MTEIIDENTPLPTSPDDLMAHLTTLGIEHTLYHHEAVFTADEARHLKSTIPGVHCKNLFVKDKKGALGLIIVPDEINLDLKTLAPAIDMGRLSFGSPERLWDNLGVRPGSVCPYAVINNQARDIKIVLDAGMMEAEFISAHPLLNTMSITVTPSDILRFFENQGYQPMVIDLQNYCRTEAA